MAKENYKYDVFISYRWIWPDRPWVRKRLAPALRRSGLTVWLDVSEGRLPGRLYSETEELIRNSRRVICVISPAYVRETKKRARMVAFEFATLQEFRDHVIPILLRGRLPSGIDQLRASNWSKPWKCCQEWQKLLTELQATDPKAPCPGAKDLWIDWTIIWALRLFCAAAIIYGATLLTPLIRERWPIESTSSRIAIRTINGQAAKSEMLVAPSGSIAGEVGMEVVPESSVFVYLQHKDDGDEDVWQCVGTSPVNRKTWSLENVDFRLPVNARVTKIAIQVLLRRSSLKCGSLQDSYFSRLTKGSAPPLLVTVRRPQVSIKDVVLSRTQTFSASGTAENILEDKEELCVWVSVSRDNLAVFNKCFRARSVDGKWSISEPAMVEVRARDKYTVEVGLVPPGFKETFRPDNFAVLDTREGYVQ
jgi:hypothetical protein